MKTNIEASVVFHGSTVTSGKSDGHKRIVHGIATREGVFRAGANSDKTLYARAVFRPGDLIKKYSDTLVGKYLYLGVKTHPTIEDPEKASGRIVSVNYDPVSKSLHYDAEVDESKVPKETLNILDSGKALPNSVRSSVYVDWTPGTYEGEKYDGVERMINFAHVSEVEAGACPLGKCGVGLHCSCNGSVKSVGDKVMVKFPGTISVDALKGFLASSAGMSDEVKSEHAVAYIEQIVADAGSSQGMFAPHKVSYPALVLSDQNEFSIVDVESPEAAKTASSEYAKKISESFHSMSEELNKLKTENDSFKAKEKQEMEAKKKSLLESLVANHEQYQDPKIYEKISGLPLEVLEIMALDSKHESSDGGLPSTPQDQRPQFTLDHGRPPNSSTKGIGLGTMLNKDQHVAIRKALREKIGRDVFPQSPLGYSFGNQAHQVKTPDGGK